MAEMIRKVLDTQVKEVSDRVLEFLGSTDSLDRDGETIQADAWNLKNFKKNPIVMWAHRYDQPPIGKAVSVKATEEGLTFKVEFADRDTYEFADTIYRLYKGGFLHATSVGFIPLEWDDGEGEKAPRRTYTKAELLELSAVPVPSNPNALITARDTGIITVKEFDAVTKPEVTENYIRIPVKGEEGMHEGHRIRTIVISEEKGIKGLYCGEDKVVITYLFDKEKWTVERAEAWVKEHEKKEAELSHPGPRPVSQEALKDELDYFNSLLSQEILDESNKDTAWELVRSVMGRFPGGDIPVDIGQKIGAVLSNKNKSNLKQAQALIQEVLDSAEKPETEEISQDIIAIATSEVMRLLRK